MYMYTHIYLQLYNIIRSMYIRAYEGRELGPAHAGDERL